MRTYEILDRDGHVVGRQEMEDSFAPSLLAGQTARLVQLDDDRLARNSRPIIGTVPLDAEVKAVPEVLVTEADAAAARERAKAEKEAAKAVADADKPAVQSA